jgi:hypothetical protein
MEQVLDIYKLPYNKRFPVVCMDESPKQLIGTTRMDVPMKIGQEKRVDFEYIRKGICNIFIANEPLKGKRYVKITERKTKIDWAQFIKEIADQYYPHAEKITLIMDNFKTHSPAALYEIFEPAEAKRLWDRFNFIYTPVHGSWLNMAEIELSVLQGQCLRRHIDNLKEIKKEVCAWMNARNNKNAKINWHFQSKDARIKLKKLYPSINN